MHKPIPPDCWTNTQTWDKLYPIQGGCARDTKHYRHPSAMWAKRTAYLSRVMKTITGKQTEASSTKSPQPLTFWVCWQCERCVMRKASQASWLSSPAIRVAMPDASLKVQHFIWQHKCYVFSRTEPVICSAARFHHLLVLGAEDGTLVFQWPELACMQGFSYYSIAQSFGGFFAQQITLSAFPFFTLRKQHLFYRPKQRPCGPQQQAGNS